MFKLAVICGGPSAERGISLNSARSVLDHISPHGVEIVPIYFNQQGEAYHLSPGQLYSNTPSDFDFKLKRESKPLAEDALIALLKKCDLAFPAIHGAFGEDGKLQRLLEKNHIPFTGPTAETCQRMFDKYHAAQEMKTHGFETLPSLLLTKESSHADAVEEFFAVYNLKRVIVKPTSGGS